MNVMNVNSWIVSFSAGASLRIMSLAALVLYFFLLLLVVVKEKRNRSVLDYFFGGRTLPFWALSITFIASWWGAGSALSTADLAFSDGIGAFWYYGVPVLISTFFLVIGARHIRRVGFLTQGEMMRVRYSPLAARMLSLMILLFMTVTAASQMVGVGDFFGTYIGLEYEAGVLSGTGIVLVYSLFGGFRGVVLTDIIQFVLMVLSAVIVFGIAYSLSGGFSCIDEVARLKGNPGFTHFTSGAGKYFSYVITFGCAWMIQANVWQRISAARTDTDARSMAVCGFFIFIPLYLIVVLTGMAGITLYENLPEGGIITTLVTSHMSPLLGACVFVGISAAIMSTMDSLINTGAMTFSLDLWPFVCDEQRKLLVSRLATLGITGMAIVISLLCRSILEVSWIASDIITTGVFVPLLAGFVWRRGNSWGAVASMCAGFLFCVYNLLISLGVALPVGWNPQSASQVLIGIGLSAAVYVSVSLLTPAEYEKADAFISAAEGGNTSGL